MQGPPFPATTGTGGITDSDRPLPPLATLKRKILVDGLARVDGRIHAARQIRKWQRELAADLGGLGALSTAQKTLLELATRTRLLLEHLDSHLMQQKTFIVKRKGKLQPFVMDRMRMADVLTRQLLALGLERKSKVIPALGQYVEDRYTPPAQDAQSEKPR